MEKNRYLCTDFIKNKFKLDNSHRCRREMLAVFCVGGVYFRFKAVYFACVAFLLCLWVVIGCDNFKRLSAFKMAFTYF